ncbi:sigma-70 family RNA polymerase sigma factor [Salegentibacter sp. F188]|uniref:Sigma-70 family RNA polymerase sigma factor n=1 Tax=Autumnicola patrickiae TaxID=3075591 RepID=A0ABU3E5M7_9FLAO|nr:sigma-70 family RNA polymerase sigma factor [Salegentibacter sp. F188]MDT0691284.1 sigma-70 family RNA polymerase sigma factor [Salegentibacter sp. F188]
MDKKNQFIQVVKKNEGLIFKVAMLYTNNLHDGEDLYQEIVFQLWKSFDSFNEQSKLSTWMYRVAMNTAIYNLKRSKRKLDTVPINLETVGFAEVSERPEEERLKLLYEHIQMLNLLEKGIILLFLEGKSHKEIAEIIGVTTSNVGTKISRIKEKLKTQIIKK